MARRHPARRRVTVAWLARAALVGTLAAVAGAGPVRSTVAQTGRGLDPAATFDPATFRRPAGWSTALRYWQTLGRAYAARGLPQPPPPAVRTAQVLAARPAAPAPAAGSRAAGDPWAPPPLSPPCTLISPRQAGAPRCGDGPAARPTPAAGRPCRKTA